MTTITCPNCAWENDASNKRCVHCNCKLGAISAGGQVAAPQKQSRSSSPANIVDAVFCSSCSVQIAREAAFCPSCGHPNKAAANYGYASGNGMVDGMPIKSRVAAGLLALFVGGLGVHKFYCGHIGLGVVYLIFFWTFIPAIIAFIEGIIYLTSPNDEVFTKRYCQ